MIGLGQPKGLRTMVRRMAREAGISFKETMYLDAVRYWKWAEDVCEERAIPLGLEFYECVMGLTRRRIRNMLITKRRKKMRIWIQFPGEMKQKDRAYIHEHAAIERLELLEDKYPQAEVWIGPV